MADSYRFGAVEVHAAERQVLVDGKAVAMGARAFDVLLALIERRDRLVSKAELLDVVWPGVIVEESNVQVQVSGLRRALGPDAIATIPGRGYRFTASLEGASATAPARTALASPRDANDILGRDADIASVERLLADHRLVTICGSGGIGKTCLARSCVARASARHAHGAGWVDLSALASPEAIPASIAHAAGLELGDGRADELLGSALAGRDLLLVLDNCEHLADAVAPLVRAMLASGRTLRVLATSQVPLRIADEHVHRLGPLPVPPPDAPPNEARSYAALQLLVRRAQAADSRFSLDDRSVDAAVALCRHLDGIPLALEMAAARLPTLGARGLSQHLAERLQFLRSGDSAAPSRQHTLKATLEWSYSLLTAQEKAVLRRLAVFSGSFPLESAQRVAAADGLDEWLVLDALASLVDKSLVQADARDPPRYRLLETTRLHALEALEHEGELEDTFRRHGAAMSIRAAEAIKQYLYGSTTPDASPYFDDYDDLNAAFERAAEACDVKVAADVSRMLNMLDFERNVHANVRRRKELALRLLPAASGAARAQLITTLGLFRTILLPQLDRVEISRDRVAAWRELGNDYQVYIGLARLGSDLAVKRDYEGADHAFAEAQRFAKPGWPPVIRWFHHFGATNAAFYRGDAAQALRWASEMLAVCEHSAWKSRAAEARVAVAHATLCTGDAERALEIAGHAECELRAMGHGTNLADALSIQAAAHASAGRLKEAAALLRTAAMIPRPVETALSMFDLAGALLAMGGDFAAAARVLGFADQGYASCQDRRFGVAERVERDAATLIERALGIAEQQRLRDEGAAMSVDEAFTSVRVGLDRPSSPSG